MAHRLTERVRALASSVTSSVSSSVASATSSLDTGAAMGDPLVGQTVTVGRTAVLVERVLADGGFARVYAARIVANNRPVALKRVSVANDPSAVQMLQTEIEVMRKLTGHKNVVALYDSDVQPGPHGTTVGTLVMELCTGGGVIDLMNSRLNRPFSNREVLLLFYAACEGVAHMHYQRPPIAHRDLKVENLLLSADGVVKLCDFGSATVKVYTSLTPTQIAFFEEEVQKQTTMPYRAPELIDLYMRKTINEKVDVWALGVLLYKLMYFKTPFEDTGNLAILNGRYTIPPTPPYAADLVDLIAFCLQTDPDRRPNIYQVVARCANLLKVPCPIENIYADAPAPGQPHPAASLRVQHTRPVTIPQASVPAPPPADESGTVFRRGRNRGGASNAPLTSPPLGSSPLLGTSPIVNALTEATPAVPADPWGLPASASATATASTGFDDDAWGTPAPATGTASSKSGFDDDDGFGGVPSSSAPRPPSPVVAPRPPSPEILVPPRTSSSDSASHGPLPTSAAALALFGGDDDEAPLQSVPVGRAASADVPRTAPVASPLQSMDAPLSAPLAPMSSAQITLAAKAPPPPPNVSSHPVIGSLVGFDDQQASSPSPQPSARSPSADMDDLSDAFNSTSLRTGSSTSSSRSANINVIPRPRAPPTPHDPSRALYWLRKAVANPSPSWFRRKYIRRVVVETWRLGAEEHPVAWIFDELAKLTATHDPVTCLRALHVIHSVLYEGPPRALVDARRRMALVDNMRKYFGPQAAKDVPHTRLIVRYAELLVRKVALHETHDQFEGTWSLDMFFAEFQRLPSHRRNIDFVSGSTVRLLLDYATLVDETGEVACVMLLQPTDTRYWVVIAILNESFAVYAAVLHLMQKLRDLQRDELHTLLSRFRRVRLGGLEFHDHVQRMLNGAHVKTDMHLPPIPEGVTATSVHPYPLSSAPKYLHRLERHGLQTPPVLSSPPFFPGSIYGPFAMTDMRSPGAQIDSDDSDASDDEGAV